jgi:hypothetical protein
MPQAETSSPVETCEVCERPVEDAKRCWIEGVGIPYRRFWLCNEHHQDGRIRLSKDEHGFRVLHFDSPVTVSKVHV